MKPPRALRPCATISEISVAYTGVAELAFLGTTFEQVNNTKCDALLLEQAAKEAVAAIDIGGDVHAPADYRRHLATVAAIRAVETAYRRAGA